MITIHKMTVKSFLPVFFISILFFVLILELVDMFSNLWRYYNNDVTVLQMLKISLLYLPKCIFYSVPIALLFSIAFALGTMYANNELIAVLGAGISFYQLILPLILIGILLSGFQFWFENSVVIPTYKEKEKLYNTLVNKNVSYDNKNVTVISDNNRAIYRAGYYNNRRKTLTDVMIVIKDERGNFKRRIDAAWAEWNGKYWILHNARIFSWDSSHKELIEEDRSDYSDNSINKKPDAFKEITRKVEEMNFNDATEWIKTLKKAGLPYREALTNYYKKIAFSLTPLIVVLLSSVIGSSFKKNILLMSLISALSLTVVYYGTQMFTSVLAKNGYIPPLMGAWAPFIIFFSGSVFLFRYTKT